MSDSVPTRRISFDDAMATVPRYFANGGDPVSSHFLALLSATFPAGEDGFVRSVRHYRDQITDVELRRDVAGFIGQEATHGREHRVLNERLADLGYPTKRFEHLVERSVRFRGRLASPMMWLADTAAMEHVTATLAELALTDEAEPSFGGDTVVGDLLLWHALEESEHKAVAFDVFRAVDGTERQRRRAMNLVCLILLVGGTVLLASSVLRDPEARRPRTLWASLRRFRSAPVLRRDTWRSIRAYNRPGFHPDDRDTRALVAHWRAELFGPEGALNDRLVASRAA